MSNFWVKMLVLSLSGCVIQMGQPHLTESWYSLSVAEVTVSGARPVGMKSQFTRSWGKCQPLVLRCVQWRWEDLTEWLRGLCLQKQRERKGPDSQKSPECHGHSKPLCCLWNCSAAPLLCIYSNNTASQLKSPENIKHTTQI